MTGSAPTVAGSLAATPHGSPCRCPRLASGSGWGKTRSYEAAHRGEIPVIRIGRRLLVPIAAFEAMLAVKSKQEIVAAELVRRLQRDEPREA